MKPVNLGQPLENGKWVPTFPNARYLFSRRDFEHFGRQELEDDHLRAFRDSVLPVYEAGRAELIEADIVVHREVSERVWLEPAFGPSPDPSAARVLRAGDAYRYRFPDLSGGGKRSAGA